MNINRQPAATLLMTDIKHQLDEFWLTSDIKHQPDTVLVDVYEKYFFIQAKMAKCSQNSYIKSTM